jgi:hypothetical protein
MHNPMRTLRIVLMAAMAVALLAAVVSLPACGGKAKKTDKPTSAAGKVSKPGVRSSAEDLAQYIDTLKGHFAEDVGGIDSKLGTGEIIRHGALARPEVRAGLRQAAETAQADIVCILSADGKHTLLRMSDPAPPTAAAGQLSDPEFWAIQGECAAGPCVDMRALIQRALDTGEPVTSFEAYPPELLAQERVLTFRAKELDRILQSPTTLEGTSLADACKVTTLKPKQGSPTEEPRALVMSDVRPVRDADGEKVWGVLVSAWVLSRSQVIPLAQKQKTRADVSFLLFQTRVASTFVQSDGATVVGQRFSADTYRQIEADDEYYQRDVWMGDGRMDVCFRRILDGTGNMIGALLTEAPAHQAGEEFEELPAPAASSGGAAKSEGGAEGHGAAKGAEAIVGAAKGGH